MEAVIAQTLGEELTVFNLGLSGAPPMTHFGWTGYILNRPELPRLAILHVSPYMFSSAIVPSLSREALSALYRAPEAIASLWAGVPVEDSLAALTASALSAVSLRRRVLAMIWDGAALGAPVDLGKQGYIEAARVSAAVQARRARGRARGYKKELDPPATFNAEQFALLEATVKRFTDAGVQVLLLTTPSARPLWRNDTPDSIYPLMLTRVGALARSIGTTLVDYRDATSLADHYFSDGDHLNPEGALRYTTWMTYNAVLPALAPQHAYPFERWSPATPASKGTNGCRIIFDFEDRLFQGWKATGRAFRWAPGTGAQGEQGTVTGYGGLQLLNSYDAALGDTARGTLTSPEFRVEGATLSLLIGGGDEDHGDAQPDTAALRVSLKVKGQVVKTASGHRSETLSATTWDVSQWRGERARIIVEDQATGSWGHIMVDQIQLCR